MVIPIGSYALLEPILGGEVRPKRDELLHEGDGRRSASTTFIGLANCPLTWQRGEPHHVAALVLPNAV
jgi:hypothetical protein